MKKGRTDYPTFCKDCVENEITGWTLDFNKVTCAYFA
ncbi:DUF1398 family protein [uncultured Chryseobacterium sp.]